LNRFRDVVNFDIARKRRKLELALDLFHHFGTKKAANEWLRIYRKDGSRWVEREEHFATL
jgi:hypothetical protein